MKTIKTTIAILSFSILSLSCSKDNETTTPVTPPVAANPEVNPLAPYLIASGFNEKTTNQINLSDYEFGISFKPIVNGKITAFVVKIPDVNPTLRMTIWNKTTATVLKTETINYATAGQEVTKAITPLDVVAGTEYFVTFNSNDWYDHRRNNSSNTTYPLLIGDISITSYAYISGTAQAMPYVTILSYYAGDISFKFQKT
jgi:Domain of unknown function (DUF4082)